MYPLLESIRTPEQLKILTVSEMKELAQEIREFMLESISHTGGHLASNLGVVELTLALHYVYNSPIDKLIWDVGHQSYVHKILTERKDIFYTLRQYQGISGFPKRSESVHDIFETGHSSTAISAALGMARARDIKGQKHHVVAIVGDGALTGGMAFEALNDVGHCKTNLTVILNDNEMSISRNVGALAEHLSKIRSSSRYHRLKRLTENIVRKIPFAGNQLAGGIERVKNSFKYLVVPGVIFEEMGFTYLGPIEGHSINSLVNVFNYASQLEGPTIIHVITKKGKGYFFAENNPERFHGVSPFNVKTGEISKKAYTTYSQAFGAKLVELAKQDDRVVAVTAAMPESTGLMQFKEHFPERFFDVGIAEQHAITMAAGLASSGLKPYVAIYSTFLQRAYDQILHDVCLQKLPVILAIDRAGLVGQDGETHQGVFDISYLRHIPNITIMAPKDMNELQNMMAFALNYDGPIAIRYPRGSQEEILTPPAEVYKASNILEWESISSGKDCCLLAVGRMVATALEVQERLNKIGINIKVVNARLIKPLDEAELEVIARDYSHLVTLEDNMVQGGFGSAVNEFLYGKGYRIPILNLGIPDQFIPQGTIDELFNMLSLDSLGVSEKIKNFLKNFRENTYVKTF